jgi:DNA-directed RNA polymerase
MPMQYLRENRRTTECPTLIDRQEQLEEEQIRHGAKKLKDTDLKAEQRQYASSTIYGVTSIQELIPAVEAKIEEISQKRIVEGKNGVAFKEIAKYIPHLEPLACAGITCKIVFDRVFSVKDPDDSMLTNVYDAVGTALMRECQFRYYQETAPGLFHTIKKNYHHRSSGTQQKVTNVQILMNRYDVKWTNWSRPVRVKLGNVMVDAMLTAARWFESVDIRDGRKSKIYLVPTALFMDHKDRLIKQAEFFSAEAYPMLIPPCDWSNSTCGGYLFDEVMNAHDMVRRGDPDRIQGEKPIEFLNKIQKVGYQLNPFVVGVAETLYEKGVRVGKAPKFIPSTSTEPLPVKPPDIETNKAARQAYKRAAAEVHNRNNDLVKKSVRTRLTMKAVKKFKDEVFYIPWSFDYRGRAYPIPSFLTPQDTDFGKSLLVFAKSSCLTFEAEEWLAFQVATTYGLDKKPLRERIDWVKENSHLISAVACDPVTTVHLWEKADEPWQFLAACDEYYHCVLVCDRHFTSLPIAVDATCSGMQILAGLARDASTAKRVNVTPSDKPQDAYMAVVEAAMANIPKQWQEHVDRGVAKRLVMTIPYNAKFKSNWGYVNSALNDPEDQGGKALNVPKDDVTTITHALRDAAFDTFPGPMRVMKWIESEVGKALKRGLTELVWTTPSGFVVTQKIMKAECVRLDLKLLGQVKKTTLAVGDSDEVNTSKHKAATAPNLIHSLDASLLHLTALRFDAPIALIHDSVLCRATDMGLLSCLVRETYMHLFAEHDYLNDFAQQIGAETEPPIIGDLEPSSVIDSTYFFC